jgi:chemotaxis protein histidine kinase CheA
VVVALVARAEDEAQRRAREELERELGAMVEKAPTRVTVDMVGLDEPNYTLEEAAFELDGKALRSPLPQSLAEEGLHRVSSGDVPAGRHVLRARLVIVSRASVVLSDEGGYRWKVSGEVSFDAPSGIEVQVKVTPQRDGTQRDVSKRFAVRLPAQPVMLAKLDDGRMPEAAKKPGAVDAGPSPAQLAAEEAKRKAEQATEEKRLAAEEAKRKAEQATEEKRLAAEEAKRKAEQATEEKRLAAEEAKRRAEQATEEKRHAVDEARRKAEPSTQAPRVAAEAPSGEAPRPPKLEDPRTAPEAARVDQPAVEPALAATVDAGVVATPEVASEGSGGGWWLIGACGVGGLVALALLARRRASLPRLDD